MTPIIIITNGNYFARLIINKVIQKYHNNICGIIVVTGDYKGHSGLQSALSLFKVTAFPYLLYKLFQIVMFNFAQKIFKKANFDVEHLAFQYKIPVQKCISIKESRILQWTKEQQPDLVISVSCPQMIGKKILSTARLGGINIHSSLLPQFAGLAPYYWVLSRGEKFTGTTVHYMTHKFDEGNILVQKQLSILPSESAFHLFKRLAQLGELALDEAVTLVLEGDLGVKQDLSQYTYFSNPTYSSYYQFLRNKHVLIHLHEVVESIREEMIIVSVRDK